MIPVFRHIRVNLALANDDEAGAVLDHDLQNIGPAREQMSDEVVSAL